MYKRYYTSSILYCTYCVLQILQVQEKEDKKSKDLIKSILEEEQALQLQQEKEDEQFARKLSEEFKQMQVLYNLGFYGTSLNVENFLNFHSLYNLFTKQSL